jgi:ATP-dependent DNA ligase
VRRLEGNGQEAWAEVLRRGLEGYVGKDPTSTYRTGGRTRMWLKSKVRQEGEFLVGGVVKRMEGWSLLVGSVSGDQLVYRGLIHFGVGRKLADALKANGLVRSTSPFSEKITERRVTWLEPRLTASVTYTEILPQGRLRAGSGRLLANSFPSATERVGWRLTSFSWQTASSGFSSSTFSLLALLPTSPFVVARPRTQEYVCR